MIEVTDRIFCADDDGNRYLVVEYTKMITSRPLSGRSVTTPGPKDYRTSDGLGVNYIDEDTFKIVRTNTIVRRVE